MKVLYETELFNILLDKNEKGFYSLRFGNALQWNSADEYRYHQVLFGLPVLIHPEPQKVLVLGGGDGLGVRELLKFKEVEEITLVDISEEMIFLARKHPVLRRLNQDSLNSPKVKVVNADAYEWVKELRQKGEKWDIVIADYPDPDWKEDNQVNRLFTKEHFEDIKALLKEDGIFSAQSTSVFVSPNVFRLLTLQLAEVFKTVVPLRVNTFSFGDVGLTLSFDKGDLIFKRQPSNHYFYTQESINNFVFYHKDELPTLPDEVILSTPLHRLVAYDLFENPYERALKPFELPL